MSYYAWDRDAQLEADAGRLFGIERLRASDEMCSWCDEPNCPSRNMGGICPLLEQEQDAREAQAHQFGAMRGTSRF